MANHDNHLQYYHDTRGPSESSLEQNASSGFVSSGEMVHHQGFFLAPRRSLTRKPNYVFSESQHASCEYSQDQHLSGMHTNYKSATPFTHVESQRNVLLNSSSIGSTPPYSSKFLARSTHSRNFYFNVWRCQISTSSYSKAS